jgi:hypothetical protein
VSPVVSGAGREFSKPFASNKNKYAEYRSFSVLGGQQEEKCHQIQTSKLGVILQEVALATL